MSIMRIDSIPETRFMCDDLEDLKELPTQMGSTCWVIGEGCEYMCNGRGEWINQTIVSSTEEEEEVVDLSQFVTKEELNLDQFVTNEALAAMPFAKIMRENGEHKIALGPTNDMLLVDKMDELGPGLYTLYMERSCQDIPAGAKEIDSSCRGIFFVDTYKIAEQNSQHFYGWALLFDHGGNVYSKYVRRSVASEWKAL